MKSLRFSNAITPLKSGKVGILATDTIYGIVGCALIPDTVEKIYKLRERTPIKPLIILISSVDDLNLFNIRIDGQTKNFLNQIWPDQVSVILSCPDDMFKYLHRGTNTLAFRIPNKKILLKLLGKTGPLVAPSANFEGEKPAENIKEAREYFGDNVDFYIDEGQKVSKPSTIISIQDHKITVIRHGAVEIGQLPHKFIFW